MTLPDYARVLRRQWWIPALLTMVTVITMGVLVFAAPPTYSASSTVFAAGPTSGAARSVTFPQVVAANTLASIVIQKLNLSKSVREFQRQVRISVAGANLYSVTVTDRNANQANRVAASVAAEGVVLYRQLAAQTGTNSADQALLKARDSIEKTYVAALTARLTFQAAHPSVFDPKAPIKDVKVASQAIQLQLQEDAASTAYRQVLAEISKQGLDQVSQAQDYNAFVLDQPVASANTEARIPAVLFAGAIAILVGVGLAFLLEHFARKLVLEAEEIEEMIGAPVIGLIPRANPQALRRTARGPG